MGKDSNETKKIPKKSAELKFSFTYLYILLSINNLFQMWTTHFKNWITKSLCSLPSLQHPTIKKGKYEMVSYILMLMTRGALKRFSGFRGSPELTAPFRITQWQPLNQDETESFHQMHMYYFSTNHISWNIRPNYIKSI